MRLRSFPLSVAASLAVSCQPLTASAGSVDVSGACRAVIVEPHLVPPESFAGNADEGCAGPRLADEKGFPLKENAHIGSAARSTLLRLAMPTADALDVTGRKHRRFVLGNADSMKDLLAKMAAGTWTKIENTKLAAVIYRGPSADELGGNSGPAAIMSAWSGAALDTTQDQLIVWGGGHEDYYGNEVYAFDLRELRWKELCLPSSIARWSGMTSILPDGSPSARHTYGSLAFIPKKNELLAAGSAASMRSGNGSPLSWLFTPAAQKPDAPCAWRKAGDSPVAGVGTVAAYDPISEHVFVISNGVGLLEYDPIGDSWSKRGTTPLSDYHQTGALDPEVRILVTIGVGFINVVSLENGSVAHPAVSGATSVQSGNAPGLTWYPPAAKFVAWSGGAALFLLDPHSWTWVAHPPMAANRTTPTPPNTNGTFGRFQYDPVDNAFIVVNGIDQDVYVYKPDF
jgi:hypothetical protein